MIVLNGRKGDGHITRTGRAGREYRALGGSLLRRQELYALSASRGSQGALGSGIGHSHSQIQLSSGADMLAEAVLTGSQNAHAPQGPASAELTNLGPLGQLVGARICPSTHLLSTC